MPYGINSEEWNAAVNAIQSILSNRAKTMIDKETITYTELYNQIMHLIKSSSLIGPEDHRFHHMLGDVSKAEHKAGRGMLTVLVVHKGGDLLPGGDFFTLARELGYSVTNTDEFWIYMFKKVCVAWRKDI